MFFKKNEQKPEESAFTGHSRQLAKLRLRIDKTDIPEYVAVQANNELEKLEKTDPIAAEFSIGINYIELLLALPWFKHTKDNLDLGRAESILNQYHYGLHLVKERVLEFLAAKTLKKREKPKILIVDDEEVARANISYFFAKQGHIVKTACNGREALQQIGKGPFFDLVISDLKMDQMDGMALLEHLNIISPETHVVMLTGYATVSSAVDAMRKGATHYLSKPVELDELNETVQELLHKHKRLCLSKGPVLCFTGPPGTGKTSIGRAIATSIGRTFIRISMAGLRDEAEIRGHRRTYVGAMPGRIINEIKRAQVMNPCFMLDEIDKIGQDFRGDPASILLEVLDPEQNSSFIDHYLDIPFDLSSVMFITTANDPDKLPAPLLDRLELINFFGYSEQEKIIIAKRYLLPRQLAENGLTESNPEFTDSAMKKLISCHTHEAGVRGLNRKIGTICRKLARTILQDDKHEQKPLVNSDMVTKFLGPCEYRLEAADGKDTIGVVTSLVWTRFGGEIMFVEAQKMNGNSQLILTGSLGNILQESAHIAMSYIRSNAKQIGITENFFSNHDFHIHLPAGAVSKDGPSAGAAIAMAIISLLTNRPARRNVAITGELTLTGQILPVGGIREKLLTADRAGVVKVLLPKKNQEDVESLSTDVTGTLQIVFVNSISELIEHDLLP